jgi:hypothetical protein
MNKVKCYAYGLTATENTTINLITTMKKCDACEQDFKWEDYVAEGNIRLTFCRACQKGGRRVKKAVQIMSELEAQRHYEILKDKAKKPLLAWCWKNNWYRLRNDTEGALTWQLSKPEGLDGAIAAAAATGKKRRGPAKTKKQKEEEKEQGGGGGGKVKKQRKAAAARKSHSP